MLERFCTRTYISLHSFLMGIQSAFHLGPGSFGWRNPAPRSEWNGSWMQSLLVLMGSTSCQPLLPFPHGSVQGFWVVFGDFVQISPRDIKSKHLSPQVAQSLSSEWGMCKKNGERPFNYRDHSWLRNSTGETWKTGSRRHTTGSFTLFIANLLLGRTRLLVYSPSKACLIVMGPVILPSLSWISLPCTSPSYPGDLA